MDRLFGNVAIAVSKYRTHCGGMSNLGTGKNTAIQAEQMATETNVFADFDSWCDEFASFVGAKGKVEPGKYRAYGYEPPGHLKEDLKAKWREIKTGVGFPPKGSSAQRQEDLDLNKDLTLAPKKSEGEKLR
jgi:hypothetical protein